MYVPYFSGMSRITCWKTAYSQGVLKVFNLIDGFVLK